MQYDIIGSKVRIEVDVDGGRLLPDIISLSKVSYLTKTLFRSTLKRYDPPNTLSEPLAIRDRDVGEMQRQLPRKNSQIRIIILPSISLQVT